MSSSDLRDDGTYKVPLGHGACLGSSPCTCRILVSISQVRFPTMQVGGIIVVLGGFSEGLNCGKRHVTNARPVGNGKVKS